MVRIGGRHMDHAVSARLEFLEQQGHGERGPFVDVVQQEDALPVAFQALYREPGDPLRGQAVPVVGVDVGAPDGQAELKRERVLGRLGSPDRGSGRRGPRTVRPAPC